MKQYKVIQGEKMSYLEVEGSAGKKYFITPFVNPLWTFIELNDQHSTTSWKTALPHQILWTCSCMDFRMGKAKRGENPFSNPCTHIKTMLADTTKIAKKLEAMYHANKGVGNHKKEKSSIKKETKNERKSRKNKERKQKG